MNIAIETRTAKQASVHDPEWWRGAVIYQIYPRSFQDSNGDGIGDLPGITKRLAYIADLGADAIWLSPFFTSPMKDFGYDVSDYRDVDPIFGTLADFDALVAEAHRLGLKVIIDQVLSHTSDLHPWFKESRSSRTNPKADWYVWADPEPDGTPPNNWLSVFGGPSWEWDSRRRQFYMHNFLIEQPDLNFHNREVQDALLDAVKFWLDRGVDGFRLDTVNFYFHDQELRSNPPDREMQSVAADGDTASDHRLHTNPYNFQDHVYDKNRPENFGFLKRLRALLEQYPGAAAVGEVGEDSSRSLEIMAAYTSGRDKLHMCYTFDFLGGSFSARHFRSTVERVEAEAKDGWPCWSFSNHDVTRYVSRWGAYTSDPARLAKLMASLILSLKGSASLYEGEELGLTEADIAYEDLVDPSGIRFWPDYKGRDGCRTPMVWESKAPNGGFTTGKPWLPIPPEHLPLAADQQIAARESIFQHYRRFLHFRRTQPVLIKGSIDFLEAAGEVIAFRRDFEGAAMLCVFNLSREPATFDLPAGLLAETIKDLGFAGKIENGRVSLGGQEAFFARLR